MNRFLPLIALAGLSVAVIGCGGNNPLSAARPDIRFVHAMNGQGNVDAFYGNILGFNDAPYGQVNDYEPMPNGNRTVTYRDATTQGALATYSQLFEEANDYTVVGYGPAGARVVHAWPDTNTASTTQARLRIINVSSTLGTVDVYVTPTGTPVTGLTPTSNDHGYEQASDPYLEFAPGVYDISVTDDSNQVVVASRLAVDLQAGQVRTAIIADGPAGPQIIYTLDVG